MAVVEINPYWGKTSWKPEDQPVERKSSRESSIKKPEVQLNQADRPLGFDDYEDVIRALLYVLPRWREIGIELHLTSGTLESFERLTNTTATRRMVEAYLASNYNYERFGPPTWRKIVQAVESPAGGNNAAEADKIARKYGVERKSSRESSIKKPEVQLNQADRPLDEDDLVDVMESLQFVQARWRAIGTLLHLRAGTLNNFDMLNPAAATVRMVEAYLAGNYNKERFGPPTWRKIVQAVGSPVGGNNGAEANKIASKYCGDE